MYELSRTINNENKCLDLLNMGVRVGSPIAAASPSLSGGFLNS